MFRHHAISILVVVLLFLQHPVLVLFLIVIPVVISPGDWIWRQLSVPLSSLFEAAAHLPPMSAGCCCRFYLSQFSRMSHHTHLVQMALFI
jgi:hypothetical protein